MLTFLIKSVETFFSHSAWIFLLGISVFLALIGPFGSYQELGLLMRFAYWMPIVFSAYFIVQLAHSAVDKFWPSATPLQWQFAAITVFSTVFSPTVWGYSKLFSDRFDGLHTLVLMTVQVSGVTMVVGLISYFVTHHGGKQDADAAEALPRLYARLPDGCDAAIVRLTVDDHYVEVFLDDASKHRILMRFADAVSEMDDTPGFYTHRSHWVASAYVREAVRESRRDFLLLETGAKVPVTKTYRESVRRAGFL
ncbi:LytTR family DNA-binding domain-containing protein [Loktanella agnita]|uniref:LytTR family DNA-binding domain-containing protein n=1 Tax=Loktanella agnita TaxID=287097 RepID=UPI0039858E23